MISVHKTCQEIPKSQKDYMTKAQVFCMRPGHHLTKEGVGFFTFCIPPMWTINQVGIHSDQQNDMFAILHAL